MIHIAQDGSGDFTTIGEALSSLSPDNASEQILYIHKGIYKEQITVSIPYVTFIGESAGETILTYDLYARMKMEDGGKRGTFRSYSCFIDTHDFTAKNLTFENSSGPGSLVGQALALYVDGDRIAFENCRFLGYQDTLFTGPLPPKEKEPGGFVGPKEFAPRIVGRQYYKNCYIEGEVDFIFGSAVAYFEHCEIFSKCREGLSEEADPIHGYVTAASTPEGASYGYVFESCRLTGNCPPHSVYLGRPWREFAKTVFLRCYLGDHIRPEGWHDWNKEIAHTTAYYGEYESYGPGAAPESRADWTHQLKKDDLAAYTKEAVLSGSDHWRP